MKKKDLLIVWLWAVVIVALLAASCSGDDDTRGGGDGEGGEVAPGGDSDQAGDRDTDTRVGGDLEAEGDSVLPEVYFRFEITENNELAGTYVYVPSQHLDLECGAEAGVYRVRMFSSAEEASSSFVEIEISDYAGPGVYKLPDQNFWVKWHLVGETTEDVVNYNTESGNRCTVTIAEGEKHGTIEDCRLLAGVDETLFMEGDWACAAE